MVEWFFFDSGDGFYDEFFVEFEYVFWLDVAVIVQCSGFELFLRDVYAGRVVLCCYGAGDDVFACLV